MMKLKLIDDWAKVWKLWSVWALVILGMLPEIMDVLVQYGFASNDPSSMNKLMKLLMVLGVFLRMISQKKAEVAEQVAAAPPPPPAGT